MRKRKLFEAVCLVCYLYGFWHFFFSMDSGRDFAVLVVVVVVVPCVSWVLIQVVGHYIGSDTA